jgi:putative methyltransferase (TIGR04325 family)
MIPKYARAALRTITPPLLLRLWRNYRGRAPSPPTSQPIWEGVYPHLRDVPRLGNGYNDERLVNDTIRHTRRVLDLSRNGRYLPHLNTPEHSLLALICSMAGWRQGSVSVLDFGGGAGVDFLYLNNSLPVQIVIDYHVVELPLMCVRAPALYAHEPRIHFHPQLPAQSVSFDVVYLSTSIQYVEDYESLLYSLLQYQPQFLFLSCLNAGEFPTYASAQLNLEGVVIPYWFLNIQSLISYLEKRGFYLLFKGVSSKEYDQSNFPEEYRMGRPCNLLFGRKAFVTECLKP